MKHFHVHVHVADLDESIRFYSTLFGLQPTVLKPDYAKWMLEDPRLNFAITAGARTPEIDHLGFDVESEVELAKFAQRLSEAGESVATQADAACCYARGDKYWASDPSGISWETFHTTGPSSEFGKDMKPTELRSAGAAACCAPTVEVFDPPMCCSTGVCGPSVDPTLSRFAADLDWLRQQGVKVDRHNLSQEPGKFAANPIVKKALEEKGTECLPLLLVGETVASSGTYPDREMLAQMAGIDSVPGKTMYSEAVAELVAIGAAIASNCEPCFKFHFNQARKLGVSREDMARAVATAREVEEAPAKMVLDTAARLLNSRSLQQVAGATDGACCGSEEKLLTITPVTSSSYLPPESRKATGGGAEVAEETSCCGSGKATAAADPAKPAGKCC
jgi:AhpD family alkylhydroperoxidase